MKELWGGSRRERNVPEFERRTAEWTALWQGRRASSEDIRELEALYTTLRGGAARVADKRVLGGLLPASGLSALGHEQGEVVCPPYCPGSTVGDWPVAPTSGPSTSVGGQRPTSVPDSPVLQYVCECQGYLSGPPGLEVETADQCAWGEGDDCTKCPTGALCPGGYRMWPQAGYWAASYQASSVQRCFDPNGRRCMGWSVARGEAVCTVGHDPGSVACRGCIGRYFPTGSNGCDECPVDVGTLERLRGALAVGGVMLGVLLVITLIPTAYTRWRTRHLTAAGMLTKTQATKQSIKRTFGFVARLLMLLSYILTCPVSAERGAELLASTVGATPSSFAGSTHHSPCVYRRVTRAAAANRVGYKHAVVVRLWLGLAQRSSRPRLW